jgi:hypothetical protein
VTLECGFFILPVDSRIHRIPVSKENDTSKVKRIGTTVKLPDFKF